MSLSHDNLLFNRVKTNFDRQGLMHHLGVELVILLSNMGIFMRVALVRLLILRAGMLVTP